MIFTFYFFISWVILCILIQDLKNHKTTIRNLLFLLLLSCFISTNSYLGLFEAQKWIKTTTEPKLFTAFLLYRNLFIPFFVSFFTLKIYSCPMKKKLVYLLFFSVFTLVVDYMNLYSNLYSFNNWNQICTIIFYLIFLLFLFFSFKWFKGLKEVDKSNDMDRKGI